MVLGPSRLIDVAYSTTANDENSRNQITSNVLHLHGQGCGSATRQERPISGDLVSRTGLRPKFDFAGQKHYGFKSLFLGFIMRKRGLRMVAGFPLARE
jgi:hypothetical protein